jgi:carbon-monoxide dehydrogenase small subunit
MSRLLDVLREELQLTGTKEGCGEGECARVLWSLMVGIVNSCLVPVAQASGSSITTIEGVATEGKLHDVQQAFIDHAALSVAFVLPE